MDSPPDVPPGPPEDANGGIQAGRYYGRSIPYLPIDDYPGKLIAIEGTDGVGRSTQIQLLREWLEVKGYGVVETGWTRSPLMQPTIELAKSSNTLNKLTFVLLYATDSWHAAPRLTLTYGVRYEPYFPWNEIKGRVEQFSVAKYQAGIRSQVFPNAPAGLSFPGDPGMPSQGHDRLFH